MNTRIIVEQHIALGWSDAGIARKLRIGVREVQAARQALDEINAQPDEPPRKAAVA